MNRAIIVLNAGSSSLKFSIYQLNSDDLSLVARGQIEGLGTTPHFKAKDPNDKTLADVDVRSGAAAFGHHEAFAHLVTWMRQEYGQTLEPAAVGHRVVHGGLDFVNPTIIDDSVFRRLEQLIPLVPLHQPHNLAGVKAVT